MPGFLCNSFPDPSIFLHLFLRYMPFQFELYNTGTSSKARAGKIITEHGEFSTPVFMPVGTAGTVKGVSQQQLMTEIRAEIILSNTYHLYLRPGVENITAAGGLHRFINWSKTILTDSGGYQVFSLAQNRKISEQGVLFQSHIDGSRHLFTPEKVMDIERSIGADIIMAFDECTPGKSEYVYAKNSMELTHRWLDRCIDRLNELQPLYGFEQVFFPIVQGSIYPDLRKESCAYISDKNAEGNAIGGLSVGEPEENTYEVTALCCEHLPLHKPRYLMGVGTPWNILECISLGIDMFDCVIPTRNGRNGMLFTTSGVINIKNKKWASDFSCLDAGLPCEISQYYSKSYLRHLFASDELLGLQLASIHNLAFYTWMMREARRQIIEGNFPSWKISMIEQFKRRL